MLLDIIDNNFLDQAAKAAIISLLDQSRATVPEGPDKKNDQQKKDNKVREAAFASLTIISALVGLIASFGAKLFVDDSRWNTPVRSDFGKFAILVLAASGVLAISLFVVKSITQDWAVNRGMRYKLKRDTDELLDRFKKPDEKRD